jgi:hypothetical protein
MCCPATARGRGDVGSAAAVAREATAAAVPKNRYASRLGLAIGIPARSKAMAVEADRA